MIQGTVHAFNPARGTGTLCCVHGTLVPFSSRDALHPGDAVTFRLVGGIAGLYALDVTGAGAAQRQTATSSSPFRWRSGTLAPSAG
ncbi:cold-shock protein [Rubrivirga sp.]|uniref:cold-shock protein n=1 Tax=Rubrivirga sp. TaxID=1885344 RepID=UPI003B515E88